MIWPEFFLSKRLSNEEIELAITKGFNVGTNDIAIVRDWSKDELEKKDVVCEVTEYTGEYPIRLTMFFRDDFTFKEDKLSIISRICQTLSCNALIEDETIDPYAYFEILPSGKHSHVLLDSEQLIVGAITVLKRL